MKETELKPCPLCGNEVKVDLIEQFHFFQYVRISCRCGLSFEHRRSEYAYERKNDNAPNGREIVGSGIFDTCDFVQAWNRRANNEQREAD